MPFISIEMSKLWTQNFSNLTRSELWLDWRPNHKKERANKIQANESTPRINRTITVPFNQQKYLGVIKDSKPFRKELDIVIESNPELFPQSIQAGYLMKDKRFSQKLKIDIRRIEVDGIAYTIRPSFVMPYQTAFTADVEKAIFLRKFDVPFWALSHVFGKDQMFWYRIEQSLGRNSIVGTTIKDPKLLPEHLSADEKHSRLRGEKVYVATTVGSQSIQVFQSVWFAWVPQNQQYGRPVNAENGSSPVFNFLFSWEFEVRRIEY